MPSQSLKKQKAKNSSIKNYKGLSRDKLLNIPNETEQAKNRKIYGYKSVSKDKLLNIPNEIEEAENRKIYDYNGMSKEKLLRITSNKNKENRNSIVKSKSLYEPTRRSLFKSKRDKIKKGL